MLIQISSGRGPAECELAVGLYLERFRYMHPLSLIKEEHGGWSRRLAERKVSAYKSVILEVPDGEEVKTGPIKWICPSPLRPGHNRKNWFIEVNVLKDKQDRKLEMKGLDPDKPDRSLIKIETFHSPGKGGQNVNKVETGARAIHLPTGLSTSSTTARTQGRNKKLAIERLVSLILNHNLCLDYQSSAEVRRFHDHLERGNSVAVFKGLDFKPA